MAEEAGESVDEDKEEDDQPEAAEDAPAEEAPAAAEDASTPDYASMTVAELKELLKAAGKPVSGKKADLIARLNE